MVLLSVTELTTHLSSISHYINCYFSLLFFCKLHAHRSHSTVQSFTQGTVKNLKDTIPVLWDSKCVNVTFSPFTSNEQSVIHIVSILCYGQTNYKRSLSPFQITLLTISCCPLTSFPGQLTCMATPIA